MADKDYVGYNDADLPIYDQEGGKDWEQNHAVVNPDGKIIGFIGGFNDDFKPDLVYDYYDGKTALGWYDEGTNVVYKHKTKKGDYVDSFGTLAGNFWQVVVEQVNSDFYLSTDDVKRMFGFQPVADKLFDFIKKQGNDFFSGEFSQFTTLTIDIAKNFVHGTGEDIIEILKAGVELYNNKHPKQQIVWDDDKIKIGDVITAIGGYLSASVEIIELALALNFINYVDKQRKKQNSGVKTSTSVKPADIDDPMRFDMNMNIRNQIDDILITKKEQDLGIIKGDITQL